ncbi:MAG: hypothetical protein WCI05_08845 [Myxococcales bacterium]|jgi:hypothetical protein
MPYALAALAILVVALVVPAFVRHHLHVSVQGRVDDDSWALAGGSSLGPFALVAAWKDHSNLAWDITVFGRSIKGKGKKRKEPSKPSPSRDRLRKWARSLDPIEVASLAVEALARVRIDRAHVRLRVACLDPTTTGTVAAVVSVLEAALSPVLELDSTLDWAADEDRIELDADLKFSVVPIVLLVDLARYAKRQSRVFLEDFKDRKASCPPKLPTS